MGWRRRCLPSCCCDFGRGGGRSGSVADDGLVWDVALKAHASGDYSVAVAQANEALEDQAQVLVSPASTLVGVYDGHGGPDAARFVNARLFSLIQEFASESGGMSVEVIKKAFGATEEEFMGMVAKSWPSQPRLVSVGSCCLVGAIEDGTLYVANLGDSRAVLGRRTAPGDKSKKRVVAERLSRDHNVADEAVRREMAEAHPDDPHIVTSAHGVWRIKGIIQVSRSIGDAYLKRPDMCSPALMQTICPFPLRRAVGQDPQAAAGGPVPHLRVGRAVGAAQRRGGRGRGGPQPEEGRGHAPGQGRAAGGGQEEGHQVREHRGHREGPEEEIPRRHHRRGPLPRQQALLAAVRRRGRRDRRHLRPRRRVLAQLRRPGRRPGQTRAPLIGSPIVRPVSDDVGTFTERIRSVVLVVAFVISARLLLCKLKLRKQMRSLVS